MKLDEFLKDKERGVFIINGIILKHHEIYEVFTGNEFIKVVEIPRPFRYVVVLESKQNQEYLEKLKKSDKQIEKHLTYEMDYDNI